MGEEECSLTREEALDILETIAGVYTKFELNEKRVDVWLEELERMSYERVATRLKEHIREKQFPPAIAEIAAYDIPENDFLEQQREWRRDARERIQRDRESEYVRPKPPWEQ